MGFEQGWRFVTSHRLSDPSESNPLPNKTWPTTYLAASVRGPDTSTKPEIDPCLSQKRNDSPLRLLGPGLRPKLCRRASKRPLTSATSGRRVISPLRFRRPAPVNPPQNRGRLIYGSLLIRQLLRVPLIRVSFC